MEKVGEKSEPVKASGSADGDELICVSHFVCLTVLFPFILCALLLLLFSLILLLLSLTGRRILTFPSSV